MAPPNRPAAPVKPADPLAGVDRSKLPYPPQHDPKAEHCSICGIDAKIPGVRVGGAKFGGSNGIVWLCQWCFFEPLGIKVNDPKPNSVPQPKPKLPNALSKFRK